MSEIFTVRLFMGDLKDAKLRIGISTLVEAYFITITVMLVMRYGP